ncbi:MAG: hypothetical protein V3V08_23415 [Nannocystaceae bacterium]
MKAAPYQQRMEERAAMAFLVTHRTGSVKARAELALLQLMHEDGQTPGDDSCYRMLERVEARYPAHCEDCKSFLGYGDHPMKCDSCELLYAS